MMVSRELFPFFAGRVVFFSLSLEIVCRCKGCYAPRDGICDSGFVHGDVCADFCACHYLQAPNCVLESRRHGRIVCDRHWINICMSFMGFNWFDLALSESAEPSFEPRMGRDNPDVGNRRLSLGSFPRGTTSSALHPTSVKQKK